MRWMGGAHGLGARTNAAVSSLASSVDGQTREVARQTAPVLVLAVQLLRWPALALLILPAPAILGLLSISLFGGNGALQWVSFGILAAMLAVLTLFGIRRVQLIRAVAEPEQLATELGIAVEMTGRIDESREVLANIAHPGRIRVFRSLKGLWRGVALPEGWIAGIDDLPRARYFFPPRAGTTVNLAVAALFMTPVSWIAFIVLFVAALAN